MIEQLIGKVFADRDATHHEHWLTKSYAVHEALGDFYTDVIGALDSLVEAHIGCFGPIGDIERPVTDYSLDNLRETADWIEVNRKEISGESDAVANLVDGVTAVYLKAIYKLGRFK